MDLSSLTSYIRKCTGSFKVDDINRCRPTTDSVNLISTLLDVELPLPYIELAKSVPEYARHFCSIGNDYDNTNHIIKLNIKHKFVDFGFRVPAKYIIIRMDIDLDCDIVYTRDQNKNGLVSYWDLSRDFQTPFLTNDFITYYNNQITENSE